MGSFRRHSLSRHIPHVAGSDQRLSTRAPPSAGRRPAAVVDRPGRSWPPGPWSWRRRRGPHGGRERRRRARDARTAAGRVDSRPAPARERRGGRLRRRLLQAAASPRVAHPLSGDTDCRGRALRGGPQTCRPARRRLAAHVPVAASLSRLGRSDRRARQISRPAALDQPDTERLVRSRSRWRSCAGVVSRHPRAPLLTSLRRLPQPDFAGTPPRWPRPCCPTSKPLPRLLPAGGG